MIIPKIPIVLVCKWKKKDFEGEFELQLHFRTSEIHFDRQMLGEYFIKSMKSYEKQFKLLKDSEIPCDIEVLLYNRIYYNSSSHQCELSFNDILVHADNFLTFYNTLHHEIQSQWNSILTKARSSSLSTQAKQV